ncbi:Lrp/AsnC family transcriptional regulator [Haloterrigena alkaliphila]|uniref:Lrp/AsnC family transcriptional regulator n=1 Tax=Haloterrigena alkaliphila TaxID=2816475 RepID=A0A8A2VAD6_9EURY|nr:Lrp/AsnC family transcriptional regulator [Haloterrigena alkaliphila]QSW98923.1 Lrp/AsnC family transcriptional regulator [Haloterrigena alkaliphila]
MGDSPLDDVDRSILHHLQENARNTVTDIATEVGVSGNTVRNRMEELEKNGIIRGYSVDIDYKEAGLDLHFAFTCTAPISKREDLARDILAIPGVIEVREFMTGQENIYLEALGTDAEDITRIAHEIDELGAEIHIERLIRNDFSNPFDPFRPSDE